MTPVPHAAFRTVRSPRAGDATRLPGGLARLVAAADARIGTGLGVRRATTRPQPTDRGLPLAMRATSPQRRPGALAAALRPGDLLPPPVPGIDREGTRP